MRGPWLDTQIYVVAERGAARLEQAECLTGDRARAVTVLADARRRAPDKTYDLWTGVVEHLRRKTGDTWVAVFRYLNYTHVLRTSPIASSSITLRLLDTLGAAVLLIATKPAISANVEGHVHTVWSFARAAHWGPRGPTGATSPRKPLDEVRAAVRTALGDAYYDAVDGQHAGEDELRAMEWALTLAGAFDKPT